MDAPPDARPDASPDASHERLSVLTWAGLLARWIDVAKASVALPQTGDAGRWRRSIPTFIELQATVCALRDLGALPEAERPLARDRAEVLVRRAGERLHRIWRGAEMPEEIAAVRADVTVALREAIYAGLVELVWPGPGVLEVPEVDLGERVGTLAIMPPGSLAMPGEPVAWFTERAPIAIAGCVARMARVPRQVYRELDESGKFVRDVVAPLETELRAGLPMLVPLTLAGTSIGRFLSPRDTWLAMQRAALESAASRDGSIPVIEAQ